MSRIFDMTETGEPTERTKKLVAYFDAFIRGKPGDDSQWRDATEALLIVLVRQLLRADNIDHAFKVALELINYGRVRYGR